MKFMRKIGLAMACLGSIGSAHAATPREDIIALVQTWAQAVSHKNGDEVAATYAPNVAIIDEFPPHAWSGPNAARDFWNGFAPSVKDMADFKITPSDPSYVRIEDTLGTGYAVFPLRIEFTGRREFVKYDGTVTYAFVRIGGKWRIASWAYSRGQAVK